MKEENEVLRWDVKVLQRDNRVLLHEKRGLVRRQLMCCIYTALGHPDTASRHSAFTWLTRSEQLLQAVFKDSREQIQHLLDLMDPEP